MRPANDHRETCNAVRRAAPGVLFILALTVAAPVGEAAGFKPPAGGVHVGELTPGACVVVCEALSSMCKDAYINDANGDCWLVLDKGNAAFARLDKSCPRSGNTRFTAEMTGGQWHLACAAPPAGSGGKAKSPPGSTAIEKLPDIKPF